MQIKNKLKGIRDEIIENKNEMNNCKKELQGEINRLKERVEQEEMRWRKEKEYIDSHLKSDRNDRR